MESRRLTMVVALAVVLAATGVSLIVVPQRSSGEPIAATAIPETATTTMPTATTFAPCATTILGPGSRRKDAP